MDSPILGTKAQMKISLDVDSTLAASSLPVFEELAGENHGYTYDDIERWDWGFDEFGKDEYLGAFHDVWSERPLDVPPMEHGLAETTAFLSKDHRVDIVTAKPTEESVSEGKKRWLDEFDITYDNFVEVHYDVPKTEYDYHVYIDDKPTLPSNRTGDEIIFIRDHRYNRNISGKYRRVNSVAGAAMKIQRARTPKV